MEQHRKDCNIWRDRNQAFLQEPMESSHCFCLVEAWITGNELFPLNNMNLIKKKTFFPTHFFCSCYPTNCLNFKHFHCQNCDFKIWNIIRSSINGLTKWLNTAIIGCIKQRTFGQVAVVSATFPRLAIRVIVTVTFSNFTRCWGNATSTVFT